MRTSILLPALTAVALTAAAAISFARGGEATAGDIAVTAAWARATPPGASVGAAYLTIENRGGAEDRLVGASSPVAQSVTPHATVEENGVATMRRWEDAVIPAGGAVEMAPGGLHLMLMGLSAPLTEGESVPLTLTFEAAGAVTVAMPVAPIGAMAPSGEHAHQE